MNVVKLDKPANLEAALAVVDALRQALVDGRIVCFAGVSMSAQDDLECWIGAARSVSINRTRGAVSHLLHCLHTGDAG